MARTIERTCDEVPATVKQIGRFGSSGTWKSNTERDMTAWIKRQAWSELLPDLYEFTINAAEVHGIGTELIKQCVLLPHEVFAVMYEEGHELWEYMFTGGKHNLIEFWEKSKNTDWYEQHPVVKEVPEPWLRVLVGTS